MVVLWTGFISVVVFFEDDDARAWSRAAVAFTIHNVLYQGVYGKELVPEPGLDWRTSRWTASSTTTS